MVKQKIKLSIFILYNLNISSILKRDFRFSAQFTLNVQNYEVYMGLLLQIFYKDLLESTYIITVWQQSTLRAAFFVCSLESCPPPLHPTTIQNIPLQKPPTLPPLSPHTSL